MAITTIPQQQPQDDQVEQDPLVRFLYALGIVLTAFGAMLPGGAKWSFIGIALITFCSVY